MLSKLNTQITTIDSMIHFYTRENHEFDGYAAELERKKKSQAQKRKSTLFDYLQRELECTVWNMGVKTADNNDSCETMIALSQNMTSALTNEAESIANLGDYIWSPVNKAAYVKSLKKQKRKLVTQRQHIQANLGRVDPLVGGILNMDSLVVAGLIDSHKDDQWMQLEFDSEESRSNEQYRSSHTTLNSYQRKGLSFLGKSKSTTTTLDTESYQASLAEASLKVKAKLLRVFIKRPWFKTEFFDDRNLNFVSYRYVLGTLYILHLLCLFTCRLETHPMAIKCLEHRDRGCQRSNS